MQTQTPGAQCPQIQWAFVKLPLQIESCLNELKKTITCCRLFHAVCWPFQIKKKEDIISEPLQLQMSNQLQSVTKTPALTKRIIQPLNCQHWGTPCSTERRLRSNRRKLSPAKNIALANVCPHTGNNIRNISRNSRNIFKTKHKICARVQQAVSQSVRQY